jgi:hypothetical protein
MSLPDLITTARAIQCASLATLNGSNPSYLASLITAASDAIRNACNRDFTQATYTEYYSGSLSSGTVEPLRLRQFPVLEITRIAANPRPALLVQNVDSGTNQRATVETTTTSLRVLRIASATPITNDLPFTTYPTLALMAAAVNALGGGWASQVIGEFANWPSSDLKPLQGAATALFGGGQLELYTEDVQPFTRWPPGDPWGEESGYQSFTGWRLDDETGELFGRFPRGQLNVRIDYTAGFTPLPQAIQEACTQLVVDLYNAGLVNNTLKKATLGTGSFELKDQSKAAVLSGKVSMLLAPYVDHSKVIFRQ